MDTPKLACALVALLLLSGAIAERNAMGIPGLPARQERQFDFPTVTSEEADMILTSVAVLFVVGIVLTLAFWWFREYFRETIVSLRPLCEIPNEGGTSGETR